MDSFIVLVFMRAGSTELRNAPFSGDTGHRLCSETTKLLKNHVKMLSSHNSFPLPPTFALILFFNMQSLLSLCATLCWFTSDLGSTAPNQSQVEMWRKIKRLGSDIPMRGTLAIKSDSVTLLN